MPRYILADGFDETILGRTDVQRIGKADGSSDARNASFMACCFSISQSPPTLNLGIP